VLLTSLNDQAIPLISQIPSKKNYLASGDFIFNVVTLDRYVFYNMKILTG